MNRISALFFNCALRAGASLAGQSKPIIILINPLIPASGSATRSFNGLHPKSKFLAMVQLPQFPADKIQLDGKSAKANEFELSPGKKVIRITP